MSGSVPFHLLPNPRICRLGLARTRPLASSCPSDLLPSCFVKDTWRRYRRASRKSSFRLQPRLVQHRNRPASPERKVCERPKVEVIRSFRSRPFPNASSRIREVLFSQCQEALPQNSSACTDRTRCNLREWGHGRLLTAVPYWDAWMAALEFQRSEKISLARCNRVH